MLRFAHPSTSPGNNNNNINNNDNTMDMSVLERQRAMLQRLDHQHNQQNHHLTNLLDLDHHHHQSLYATPGIRRTTSLETSHHPSYSSLPNSNYIQCNSSLVITEGNVSSCCYIKKRKAEFDVEEEAKDQGVLEEQSEIPTKTDKETSTNTCSKESSNVSEVQKLDYIHVRARRGQATDSHSLAERARREKISKKMKCLQDLVPGCNRVTGKAGMLDEIINYVQSLQKQVEFLSMKLAALNPRLEFKIDNFFAKEIPAYVASATSYISSDATMDFSQVIPHKAGISSVPVSEGFFDSSSIPQLQQLSGWDSEWQSLFNVSFH